jgi:HEPN domain-containing protein
MKPLTAEWVEKAEGDLHSCLREVRARQHPNPDSACFHAQQCAEKYLKARLQEAGLAFPKTHDLLDLLSRLLAVEPAWTTLNPQLTQLVNYAVVFRYPGISASKVDGREALVACRMVRRAVRQSLKLKD